MNRVHSVRIAVVVLLASAALLAVSRHAQALILGAAGNDPVNERPWPQGSLAVANLPSRIAWWEGPPLGGGESHFEYRGDADALNEALKAFAKIAAPKRRLKVFDGPEQSFWLNANREKDKNEPMDWVFVVWEAERFNQLFNNPANTFLANSENFGRDVPAPEISVYVGGNIDWAKVVVPEGIEIDDQRLEAHGYKASDGTVIEVSVWKMTDRQPLPSAELALERIEPQPTGGYRYQTVSSKAADKDGKIVLQGAPDGWNQLIVWAEGYAPRLIAYTKEDQPRWHHFDAYLAKAHKVTGTVIDENDKPVPGATVRIDDVLGADSRGYATARPLSTTTDEQGAFLMESVPEGFGRFRAYADDYVFKGLGETQPLHADPVVVRVVHAGKLKATVQVKQGQTPENYIIEIAPSDGDGIGKWGGSAQPAADGTYTFTHIPPGSYTLSARPNPGAETDRTESATVEIKGGETAEVTLKAPE